MHSFQVRRSSAFFLPPLCMNGSEKGGMFSGHSEFEPMLTLKKNEHCSYGNCKHLKITWPLVVIIIEMLDCTDPFLQRSLKRELRCEYNVQPENICDFSFNGSCWTEECGGPTASGSKWRCREVTST